MTERTHDYETHERLSEPQQSELVEHYHIPPFGLRIDTRKPLMDRETSLKHSKIDGQIVAAIQMGEAEDSDPRRQFIIIDNGASGDEDNVSPFTIRSMAEDEAHLTYGGRLTVKGRNETEFLEMMYDEDGLTIWVSSGESETPSYLDAYAYPVQVETSTGEIQTRPRKFESTMTQTVGVINAEHMIPIKTDEAPEGYLNGYTFIGRNTPSVREGIYGEAIFGKQELLYVDSDGPVLHDVRQGFIDMLTDTPQEMQGRENVVESVINEVQRLMHYDLEATNALSDLYPTMHGEMNTIPLSAFIEAGVGVCRQQALLTALLLEDARDVGLIEGEVRVERNYEVIAGEGHVWTVWRSPSDPEDLIVDSANSFALYRSNAIKKNDIYRIK